MLTSFSSGGFGFVKQKFQLLITLWEIGLVNI